MPRARLEEPLSEGDPALLYADPDARPGQLDGLIVDGRDPMAEHRRLMRERHDGHADPVAPPPRERRGVPITRVREETPVALNTVPLSQIPAGPAPDKAKRASPMAGDFRVLAPDEFDALPGGRYSRTPPLTRAVDALAQGKSISVSAEPKRVAATRQALRKLAKERGLTLEIRGGPDYVAARVVKEGTPS